MSAFASGNLLFTHLSYEWEVSSNGKDDKDKITKK